MRQLRYFLVLSVISLLSTVGLSGAVRAVEAPQAAPTPSGIALAPAIQDRVLGPGDKSVAFNVLLSNQTSKSMTFSLSSTDFKALNQTGGLAFLGSDVTRVTNGNGLSSFVKIDNPVVTIPANGSKTIVARVDNVAKLAPGGHYAAILAQALPDGTGAKGNRVSINQVLSSLIFLETAGQGTKTLSLLPPEVSSVSFSLPDSLNLVFKATGNTQSTVRGIATISRGDTEVARGIINENSSLLLPGSTRLLQTPLAGDKHPLWPGMYSLKVQYRFEGSLGVTTYEKKFLYVNVQAILLGTLILVLISYGVYRSRKYWKKVIAGSKTQVVAQKKRLIVIRDKSHIGQIVIVKKRPKK